MCGGSGDKLIDKAISSGADVLITGDIKYHSARDAVDKGFLVVDGTHDGTETRVLKGLKKELAKELKGIQIQLSRMKTSPWRNDV